MSHFVLVEKSKKFPFLPKERKFATPEEALKNVSEATVKITEVYTNGTADLSPMNLKEMVDQKVAFAKEEREKKKRSLENRRVILDTPKKKVAKKVPAKKVAKKRK
jgi:hypothetical protein